MSNTEHFHMEATQMISFLTIVLPWIGDVGTFSRYILASG